MKYIYTFLTLVVMLFISQNTFAQDVNTNVRSYQNWLYQSGDTAKNKIESGHFNFDEAEISFSKITNNFQFEVEARTNSNFDVTLNQAFVSYSNTLSDNWNFNITGGKFYNSWFNYTKRNTYTYSRPLISRFIPETENGIQFGVDNGSTDINIAYFNGNSDTSKRILVTTVFKPSDNLELGLFGQAKLNYYQDTGYVFGGSLSNKNYSSRLGGIKYGAEFIYSKDTVNSYLASVKAEYFPVKWKNWSIFAQGVYMVPNSKITDTYNLNIQTDLVWRPTDILDIAFEYSYNWMKNPSSITHPIKYSYVVGIKTGFNF